jgi:hypothetical protein
MPCYKAVENLRQSEFSATCKSQVSSGWINVRAEALTYHECQGCAAIDHEGQGLKP